MQCFFPHYLHHTWFSSYRAYFYRGSFFKKTNKNFSWQERVLLHIHFFINYLYHTWYSSCRAYSYMIFFSPNLTINFFLHEKFNQSFFPHPLIHTQHLSYMMLFIQRLFPHRGYIHKHNIHAEFFSTLLTSYMIIFMKRLFLCDFSKFGH